MNNLKTKLVYIKKMILRKFQMNYIVLPFLLIIIIVAIFFTLSNNSTIKAQSSSLPITCTRDTDNTTKNPDKSYGSQGKVYLDDGSYLQDYCSLNLDASSRVLVEYGCDNSAITVNWIICNVANNNSCSLGRCL